MELHALLQLEDELLRTLLLYRLGEDGVPGLVDRVEAAKIGVDPGDLYEPDRYFDVRVDAKYVEPGSKAQGAAPNRLVCSRSGRRRCNRGRRSLGGSGRRGDRGRHG